MEQQAIEKSLVFMIVQTTGIGPVLATTFNLNYVLNLARNLII